MAKIPKPVGFVVRVLLDALIVALIITFLPGLPPYVSFYSYEITPGRDFDNELLPNNKLDKAISLLDDEITGPESIALRGNELFTGIIGGDVIKVNLKTGDVSTITRFGRNCEGKWEEAICGRPLGMRFDAHGKLIVADAYYGIFQVDVDTGATKTLVSSRLRIDGKRPMNPNDLDIDSEGIIYWTDSSTTVHLEDAVLEFMGEPTGRLLKYDPSANESTVLLSGLHFPNGVQLAKNEEFVLVSETARCRVLRYYVRGDREGEVDTFVDGLPGSPDNIRSDSEGNIFVSLIAPRYHKSFLEYLSPHQYVRKFLARLICIVKYTISAVQSILPNEYLAKAQYYIGHFEPFASLFPKHAIVVQLDQDGNIVTSLQAIHGYVTHISQITFDRNDEFAYLGSPYNRRIWRVKTSDFNTVKKSQKHPEMNLS